MKKRMLATLVIISLALGLCLGACSKESTDANSPGGSTSGTGKTSSDSNLDGNFYKSGYPVVKDQISFKVVAAKSSETKDYSESVLWKEYEKVTNIKPIWNLIPKEAYEEKKNLMLATNDLPDVFFGTNAGGMSLSDLIKYGGQGMFIDMTKLINDYAPNIKAMFAESPDAKFVSMMPDGTICSLPFVQELESNVVFNRQFINKVWLDKLKLKIPTTTSEYLDVLKAFRDNDPNGNNKKDEIGFAFVFNNHNYGHYGFFGAFNSMETKEHISVKNKKVIYEPVTNEYKDGVKWLNTLYKEGLIDPESFTNDMAQYKAKGSATNILYGSYSGWGGDEVGLERYQKNYVPLAPLKGPSGQQGWHSRSSAIWRGYFEITNVNKYPKETIRWIDLIYNTDWSIQMQYGPVGYALDKGTDGKYSYRVPNEAKGNPSTLRYTYAPGLPPSYISAKTFAQKIVENESMANDNAIYKVYKPYISQNYMPAVIYTAKQTEDMATLVADISGYVNTMQAKWITGEGNIDTDWNAYTAQLNKMGLDKLMAIYQAAYDLFTKQAK